MVARDGKADHGCLALRPTQCLQRVVIAFAQLDSGSFDLGALERAKDAAQRGANIARGATAEERRAFD